MTVRILNLARLEQKLRALPDSVKAPIRAELQRAAEDIVSMAKSLVPVDSGDLRDSIGWTFGKAPRGAMVLAQAEARLGGELTATVFAGNNKAFYARWVEFGTQKMVAQPYFFVSYRANRNRAKSRIRKAVRDSARRVARAG